MLTNYVTSLIRTWTPIGVGLAATWLATHFNVILTGSTSDAVVAAVTAAAGAGYYATVRALEHRVPQLGWLLGTPAKPDYGQVTAEARHAAQDVADDVLGNFTGPDPLAQEGADPNTPGASRPAPV